MSDLADNGAAGPDGDARVIDFDQASVLTLRTSPPRFILRVSGPRPDAGSEVELQPLVYVRQPEYWEIQVVAVGDGPTADEQYEVSLEVTDFVGTEGIEVIGATVSRRFDLPGMVPEDEVDDPGSPVGVCGEWSAWLDREPPGQPVLRVTGVCTFPTAGSTVELRRREPQGINPRDLLLDRVVTSPEGDSAQVETRIEVAYAEETEAGFDTVTILPDGGTVEVREVW